MKALVFAAGYGNRLRPLTDTIPKPLIEVNGKTVLQRVIERLAAAGVDDILINTHHLHEKIVNFLEKNNNFGLKITVSHEIEKPLETGGTLKANEKFFRGGGPFFVCNADVLSDPDLESIYRNHCAGGACATLAIRKRPSSRHLMFDSRMRLAGREGEVSGDGLTAYGFSCLQVLSPSIFGMIKEEGVFTVMKTYLRIAAETHMIAGFEDRASYWFDIGSPEKLDMAARYFKEHCL
jgi:NDP-sugar pyrophosphorylase family protein